MANKIPVLLILVGITLACYSGLSSIVGGGPLVAPEPTNPGGPDLLVAFGKSSNPAEAAIDACDFGCLCQAIADQIEYDGKRTDTQFKTGVQLDNFRILARDFFAAGGQYGRRYPHLAEAAGEYLESQVGSDGGVLTDERRRKWVDAYRTLARSSHYAGDYLAWKHGVPTQGRH